MIAAIQQPHFFPWLGYFDKMAKVDLFVLMDEVQLEKRSQMTRNRILCPSGEIKYLTISSNQHGHRDKKYSEIPTVDNDVWKANNVSLLEEYYRKTPYFHDTISWISGFYESDYPTVCQWAVASIKAVKELLGITTELKLQSEVDYDRSKKKSDLILEICRGVRCDLYVAGRGASVDYLDRDAFADNGIGIVFQDFQHPVYPQINTKEFIPGISILDMLFNCGIDETRRIFWENVRQSPDNAALNEYRAPASGASGGVICSIKNPRSEQEKVGVMPEAA